LKTPIYLDLKEELPDNTWNAWRKALGELVCISFG